MERWGEAGQTDRRTGGRTARPPDKHIPSAIRPSHSQTPQQGFAASGEAAPIMQEWECGARPGCQRVPLGPVGPRPRPAPGHRDPRPRLPQRC